MSNCVGTRKLGESEYKKISILHYGSVMWLLFNIDNVWFIPILEWQERILESIIAIDGRDTSLQNARTSDDALGVKMALWSTLRWKGRQWIKRDHSTATALTVDFETGSYKENPTMNQVPSSLTQLIMQRSKFNSFLTCSNLFVG